MKPWTWLRARTGWTTPKDEPKADRSRLVTDGGEPQDESEADDTTDSEADTAGEGTDDSDAAEGTDDTDATDATDGPSTGGSSNIEITDPGEAEPVDPKWEKPDIDDIPEFETRVDKPLVNNEGDDGGATGQTAGLGEGQADPTASPGVNDDDPTAGMPNTARSPGQTRIKREGSEGFIIALELCARLPENARLPEEANDLVPVALEAELEQDIQQFAAAEFDNHEPLVSTLDFHDVDGEIWMRIRLGAPREAFDEIDVDELKSHALQEVEGLL